jgi:hypothetical protein
VYVGRVGELKPKGDKSASVTEDSRNLPTISVRQLCVAWRLVSLGRRQRSATNCIQEVFI